MVKGPPSGGRPFVDLRSGAGSRRVMSPGFVEYRGGILALLNRTTPLNFSSQTRALLHAARSVRLRPKTAAATFGGVISLAVGGAYLGGAAVQASTVSAQAERLQGAGSEGYTQEAMAAGAASSQDLQNGLRRASLTNPAARPFRLGTALDQSRDLDCLTKAAYYEARGEGTDGMRAVAQVVLNRARHSAYPNTVCAVVYQGSNRRTGCQFSFTCNGAMKGAVNRAAWNRARDVASKALSGQVYAAVGNATHFHTTGVSPSWRNNLVKVGQVGDHLFYRLGGRSGSSAAFSDTPRPSTSADAPRLVQASLSSTSSGPVAYSQVVARDNGTDASTADAAAE